jgi:hypothetical protein
MPETIKCVHCDAPLRLPEQFIGQEVRCPSCQKTFTAQLPALPPRTEPAEEPHEDESPPRRPRADDERPSQQRRLRDDSVEDEDYPRRRRARYDDDDAYQRRLEPHRGSSIQTLGIFSIVLAVCCWPVGLVLGIVALVMANGDLARMQSGSMDRSGESQTNTGKTCAVIGLILIPIVVLASCLLNAGGGMRGR